MKIIERSDRDYLVGMRWDSVALSAFKTEMKSLRRIGCNQFTVYDGDNKTRVIGAVKVLAMQARKAAGSRSLAAALALCYGNGLFIVRDAENGIYWFSACYGTQTLAGSDQTYTNQEEMDHVIHTLADNNPRMSALMSAEAIDEGEPRDWIREYASFQELIDELHRAVEGLDDKRRKLMEQADAQQNAPVSPVVVVSGAIILVLLGIVLTPASWFGDTDDQLQAQLQLAQQRQMLIQQADTYLTQAEAMPTLVQAVQRFLDTAKTTAYAVSGYVTHQIECDFGPTSRFPAPVCIVHYTPAGDSMPVLSRAAQVLETFKQGSDQIEIDPVTLTIRVIRPLTIEAEALGSDMAAELRLKLGDFVLLAKVLGKVRVNASASAAPMAYTPDVPVEKHFERGGLTIEIESPAYLATTLNNLSDVATNIRVMRIDYPLGSPITIIAEYLIR